MKITKTKVQKFLQNHTGGVITGVMPVSGGEWSQAFFYQDDKNEKVIRFSEVDEDFYNDQFATDFSSAKLPIPMIEEIGKAFGGYFAISQKVKGKMIDNLDRNKMGQIVPAVMKLFGAMWSLDTSASHGYGGWDGNGNGTSKSWKKYLLSVDDEALNSRIGGWKKNLSSREKENEVYKQAYQELVSSINICPEIRHVIHSDLLHFNLLVDNDQIVAVIDWGCGKYGDFLYDLAWFVFWQFWYPSMNGIDFERQAKNYFKKRGANLINFGERLNCYQLHIGLDSMAYCSFKENWKDVEMISKRLLELLELLE